MFPRWLVALALFTSILAPVQGLPFLDMMQEVYVEDVVGDANINGVPADHLDITHARVDAEGDSWTTAIGLVDVARAQDLGVTSIGGGWYSVSLQFEEENFDVVWDLRSYDPINDAGTQANLLRETTDGWLSIASVPAYANEASGELQAEFLLSQLKSSNDFTPGPGTQISVIRAEAYYDTGSNPRDPPSPGSPGGMLKGTLIGADSVEFEEGVMIDIPGEVSEFLGLSTTNRVRYSNGEATTYSWPIKIQNLGSEDYEFEVRVSSAPEVLLDAPKTVKVPEGEDATINVLATVPFRHEHGAKREILVEFEDDQVQGNINLEIIYLTVPQPAGHHNTVYLHASNPGGGEMGSQWMNTIELPEDRESDWEMELSGITCDLASGTEEGIGLNFPLDPKLLVGLDAHVDETAKFTASLTNQVPRPAGTIIAGLILYDTYNEDPQFMSLDRDDSRVATLDVPAATNGETTHIEMELPMSPEMDLLAPGHSKNFAFIFQFCSSEADSRAIPVSNLHDELKTTLSAGTITMPLEDYHDEFQKILTEDELSSTTQNTENTKATPGPSMVVVALFVAALVGLKRRD